MPSWPPPLKLFKVQDLSQLSKQEMAAILVLIWDIHEETQGSRDMTLWLYSKP